MPVSSKGPADAERVDELLRWARGRLVGLEASSPSQEARELCEWAFEAASTWSIPEPVDEAGRARFIDAVERRAAREPLQRITERMYFRGLTLVAHPGVFICRPETETVAQAAIDEAERIAAARPDGSGPVVVDLCTGSGAIGLAVATEVPQARVRAVEIDEAALALASRNIEALAPGRVDLVAGDATSADILADLDGCVDVVVANPPYVPEVEPVTQTEALEDPERALYGGGEDGMVVPRGILENAHRLLAPGGLVVVEHAPSQAALMRVEAADRGFVEIETRLDLADKDRMLVARRGTLAP